MYQAIPITMAYVRSDIAIKVKPGDSGSSPRAYFRLLL
jgi:hypothetical protein